MIEIVNMEEKNTEPLHKRYLNWDILVYRTFTDAAGMCLVPMGRAGAVRLARMKGPRLHVTNTRTSAIPA